MKLLIVDDDVGISEMLTRILQFDGHTVLSVSTGEGALEILEKESVDLMLLDYHLEDMNADEVLEKIKAAGLNVSFFLMSALDDEEIVRDIVKQGAIGVIEKPFDIAVIRKLVKENIRSEDA